MVEKKKTGDRPEDVEVDVNPTEARHSERGRPVLMVLAAGLVLALLAWGAVELWVPEDDPPAAAGVEENTGADQ